jgi:NAD(P) transhydrogenase subunit alpha
MVGYFVPPLVLDNFAWKVAMIIGVAKETYPGECRVAMVPASLPALTKAGFEVLVETGSGLPAAFPDDAYTEKQARIAASRKELFEKSDIIFQIRSAGANPQAGQADVALMRSGLVVIGLAEPLTSPQAVKVLADRGVTLFALELMPRVSRAQSMDVLSSMATIAGYKAVLLAAEKLPRVFPLLMTAAGTLTPAHVLVIGVGVAGLTAISTARRLGAVVEAYDIRPSVKEQVQSVGAKFVELPLETAEAEAAGGYARAQSEEFLRRQRELLGQVVAKNDVVITTAAVPGKKAPVLVTAEMVRQMAPGSVIVDLAAEHGGNCELTRPGETVVEKGVAIVGTTNLPSTVPAHASQMFSRNVSTFLMHLVKDGKFAFDMNDEITRSTLVCRGGQVVHPQVAERLKS